MLLRMCHWQRTRPRYSMFKNLLLSLHISSPGSGSWVLLYWEFNVLKNLRLESFSLRWDLLWSKHGGCKIKPLRSLATTGATSLTHWQQWKQTGLSSRRFDVPAICCSLLYWKFWTCHLNKTYSKKMKKIVEFSRRRSNFVQKLKNIALDAEVEDEDEKAIEQLLKPRKLIQDVPAWWSSTHMMLKSKLDQRVRLIQTLARLNSDLLLSTADWGVASVLCQCLAPFAEAINNLEGQQYPTHGLLAPCLYGLVQAMPHDVHFKWAEQVKDLGSRLLAVIEKRWLDSA